MNFIQQVQLELNKRIAQTDNICEQFENNYNKYSSKIRQISLLIFLGIIALALIWTMLNIDVIFKIFPMHNYERDNLLALVALASICLYIMLHIYKNTMHIIRIAKIYKLVYEVNRIKKHLQSYLNKLSDIAAKAERDIFSQTNNKLKPDYDVDADIAKYNNILRSYQNPDDNSLNVVLVVTHWLSGIFFTSIFLFISMPFVTEKISEWIHIKEYSFISLIYTSGIIALYMIFQELFAKISMLHIHNMIKKIIGYFFIIGICGILLYIILGTGSVNLLGNPMQTIWLDGAKNQTNFNYFGFIRSMSMPYMPLIICTFFSSIIYYICKINERTKYIIDIFFTVGVYAILLYLIFGLKFISFVETMDKDSSLNFIAQMFLTYAPLMTLAFSLSIISIICIEIAENIMTSIKISSVIYTIAFLIISIYTEGIKHAIIGDIIIWAIALIILAIATLIALLPSLFIFGIVDKITKQKKKSVLHLLIATLIVAGLITAVTIIPATEKSMPITIYNNVDKKPTIGTFTDSRNGKTYKTTKIGTQTWIAQNLNYDTKGSKCYNNNPENCQKYGRLYNWSAAIKACPSGWHLPSNKEWEILYRYADGTSNNNSPYKSETAAKYLKAKSGWNYYEGISGNGTDNYEFTALPGGIGNSNGSFSSIGNYGNWWSSSESDNSRAYNRFKSYKHNNAGWETEVKSKLFSVRCVQN